MAEAVFDLYDPDMYAAGPPHAIFERLRTEQPVYRQAMDDGTAYWAVLLHRDVVHVARNPLLFSAERGGVVLEDLAPDQLAMMRDMILSMDPPRHADYRRSVNPHFKAQVMAGLEPRIRSVCRSIMDDAAERGDVDFVHDVCAGLPAQIVGELVGIPATDRPQIHHWAERITGGQDAEVAAVDEAQGDDASMEGSIQLAMYAIELANVRRLEPQNDLMTLMLSTEVDGRLLDEMGIGSFFVQLIVAGNDTSRTMLSSGMHALLQHPDQMAELRDDPTLIPGAVEEMLRWANPLHYFRRTATAQTELDGQTIAEGDKVAMVYTSANRDESIFADPHRFDIHRDPNPHLSFGIAEHFCLGVHLARLEGRVFFEELLSRFSSIELTGEPRRQRSNLNNALKSLPVRLANSV
ncbi:MAG: cytochrome P450 [Actinomycetes bacterium]